MENDSIDPRVALAEEIANQWNCHDINYIVLNGLDNYPEKIGRDLDVLVSRNDLIQAHELALNVLKKRSICCITPATDPWPKKSIYAFTKQRYLEIDLIWALTWGPVPFITKFSKKKYLGPFIVDNDLKFIKTILLKILGGVLAEGQISKNGYDKDLRAVCEELLGKSTGRILFNALIENDYKKIRRLKRSFRCHLIFNAIIKYKIRMLAAVLAWPWRRLKPHFIKVLPIVAVVGPDGVGKSTIIKEINYHDSFILGRDDRHWRPTVLPRIASLFRKSDHAFTSDAGGMMPRRVPGKFYFLRLIYYSFDFLCGHFLRDRYSSSNLRTVIYDRCWLDGWVDPLRFGFSSSYGIKLIWRMLPHPDLVILLYDDPEKIYSRKPELLPDEIRDQMDRWLRLVREGFVTKIIKIDAPPEVIAERVKELIDLHFVDLHKKMHEKIDAVKWLKSLLNSDCNVKVEQFQTANSKYWIIQFPDGRGYLLPNAARQALNALALYHPQKTKAIIGKFFLKICIACRCGQFLLPKFEMKELNSYIEFFDNLFKQSELKVGISLGTPGPERKPVFQVQSNDGTILGYAKIGWDSLTNELVKNEVKMLKLINQRVYTYANFSRILYTGYYNNNYLLVTSPLDMNHRIILDKSVQLIIDALLEISRIEKNNGLFGKSLFWQKIVRRADSIKNTASSYSYEWIHNAIMTIENEIQDLEFPFFIKLGDFTPWNIAQDDAKIAIVDLEFAERNYLPGWDLFHFMHTAGEIYMRKVNQENYASLKRGYFSGLNIDNSVIPFLELAYYLDLYIDRFTKFSMSGMPTNTNIDRKLKDLLRHIALMTVELGRES